MKNAFAASTLARPDVQRLNSAFAWVCALFAGMVWQISAVMAKAVALAEENARFV